MKPSDDLIVSSVEPTGLNRKKVWMQNTADEKKIYVRNDNNVYEEFIGKSKSTNIIQCKCAEDTTTLKGEEAIQVPLEIQYQIGSALSIVDNKAIVIGEGINYIKVSAIAVCNSSTVSKRFAVQPQIAEEGVTRYLTSIASICMTENNNYGSNIGGILVPVSKGDLIYLNIYIQNGITINAQYTNITVEAVG